MMAVKSTITLHPNGRRTMTIEIDTDEDALALAAALGSVSVANIRDCAAHFGDEARDKIESVLDRSGWATPTYGAYDKLADSLKLK